MNSKKQKLLTPPLKLQTIYWNESNGRNHTGGHIRLHQKVDLKPSLARSRLEELTFGTFNVRTAAVNGVNGIGHIDTLLRICAAKGFDVIRLQAIKRDGTFEISASGYRVFLSGDYSMVKAALYTTVPRSPFSSSRTPKYSRCKNDIKCG